MNFTILGKHGVHDGYDSYDHVSYQGFSRPLDQLNNSHQVRLRTTDAILYAQKINSIDIDDWFDSYNHEKSEYREYSHIRISLSL